VKTRNGQKMVNLPPTAGQKSGIFEIGKYSERHF
jgi:hypothetical protein